MSSILKNGYLTVDYNSVRMHSNGIVIMEGVE